MAMLSDDSFILEEIERSKPSDSNGPSEKQKETEKNFETLSANPPISDLNPPISIESKTDTTDDKNIIKEVNSDRLEIINQANSDNKVNIDQISQTNGSSLNTSSGNQPETQVSGSKSKKAPSGATNSSEASDEELTSLSNTTKKRRKSKGDSSSRPKKRRRTSRSSVEELPEYTVERIVDKRFRNGRWQYLLKWEGYSSSENTWEDFDHLNCPDLLDEFEKEWARKQQEKEHSKKEKKDKKKEKRKEKHKDKPKYKQNGKELSKEEPETKMKPKECQTESSSGEREMPFKASFQASKPNPIMSINQDIVKHQLSVHDDKTVLASDKRIPVGFERGDEIQEIVGARIINGKLCLYVLWKGKNICTFVPAELCNKHAPQKVISFYESRLRFEEGTPM